MDLSFTPSAASELSAAFLQAVVTISLAVLFAVLFERYRKAYFAYWGLAWLLYALRVDAIIVFLTTADRIWLYWHQVVTGWTALGLLWAALVFSRQLPWRWSYAILALFPPVWSFIAIYRLENFLLAAGPAVLFLSGATLWTGWVFLQHHRVVGSTAAAALAGVFILWGLHHLDYPFLRARGAWNPWGYYIDLLLELGVGAGILLLVQEDLRRGLATLSALSGDLQRSSRGEEVMGVLVERPLTLPAVRGSAIYLGDGGEGRFIRGAGVCATWKGTKPTGSAAVAVERVLQSGRPEVLHGGGGQGSGTASHEYVAALPILREDLVTGALVVVGEARDPFAALDTPFLLALGQQVGAALENADLYRRLEARTRELERLASRMVEQHENERRRLFRELHDETAQAFAAVNLHLGMLLESAPLELTPRLQRAQSLVTEGIQSIRNITSDLRPSLLDDLGLVPALRALSHNFHERTGLEVRLDAAEELPPLSEESELALFRALQEALANVARHSGATRVEVGLGARDGMASLTIQDDGRGLAADVSGRAPGDNGSAGLMGMRERITALGGRVLVEGPSGSGVRLEVLLPTLPGVL